jgi:hypothetical protein
MVLSKQAFSWVLKFVDFQFLVKQMTAGVTFVDFQFLVKQMTAGVTFV